MYMRQPPATYAVEVNMHRSDHRDASIRIFQSSMTRPHLRGVPTTFRETANFVTDTLLCLRPLSLTETLPKCALIQKTLPGAHREDGGRRSWEDNPSQCKRLYIRSQAQYHMIEGVMGTAALSPHFKVNAYSF